MQMALLLLLLPSGPYCPDGQGVPSQLDWPRPAWCWPEGQGGQGPNCEPPAE
jgi:hypothetical protein